MEGVTIIYGILNYKLMNVGSRSEGDMAILTCDGGKEYALYRLDSYPIDDAFFQAYHQQRIGIKGNIEENTGYICVESILLDDGTEVVVNDKTDK